MTRFSNNKSNNKKSPNLKAWGIFLSLFVSPDKAWLRVFTSGRSSEDTARRVFYPLIALCAVLQFCSFIYNPGITLSNVLQQAIIVFIAWFIGYFGVVIIVSNAIFGEESKELGSSDNGKKLIMLSMASLTVFYSIGEILPMLEPLLAFAPIYTIFLISRGIKVIGVPENQRVRISIFYSVMIIGVPLLLRWLFESLIPEVS